MSCVSKPLLFASVIGLLLYLIWTIPPGLKEPIRPPVSKADAVEKATAFVSTLQRMNGEIALQKNTEPSVFYDSDSDMAGYVVKEHLKESFQKWEARSPFDTYRVLLNVTQMGYPCLMSIDVHMMSGHIIGFDLFESPLPTSHLERGTGDDKPESATKDHNLAINPLAQRKLALTLLKQIGWNTTQLKLDEKSSQRDIVTFCVPTAQVGQATLTVQVQFSKDIVVRTKPQWNVPIAYKSEMLRQKSIASAIKVGSEWMTVLLNLMSIVACIFYRRDIRFRSRTVIALSLVCCSISLISVWNNIAGSLLLQWQIPLDWLNTRRFAAIMGVISVLQYGLVVYFSLLAGKRLWDTSSYKNLLPTWRHTGFGNRLIRSFWIGMIYAGIQLGIVTVIFFVLTTWFGSWSTTDPSTSPVNLRIASLFPLIAWVAAISEDSVYFLFGVGLLNRCLRNPWVAGIIPTLIWACGHIDYPIFPYFSRPIELMIGGMISLFIMLKYNWWAAMFTHLMYDNLVLSLPFLLIGTLRDMMIGMFYLILPAVVAYALFKLHRTRSRLA